MRQVRDENVPGSSGPSGRERCEFMIHNVEIWRYSLDVVDKELQQLRTLLSDEEAERADRFVRICHRNRFIAARGSLRQVLGWQMGYDPAALAFDISPSGKPSLRAQNDVGEHVHFNVTHTGGDAAIALCRSAEVGIDIERVRSVRDGLAQRYFSIEEVAALEALSEPEQLEAFFRCWTRKEAFVKATGEGIKRGLDSFVVSVQPGTAARIISIDGNVEAAKAYSLVEFDAGTELCGAVCVHTGVLDREVNLTLLHRD